MSLLMTISKMVFIIVMDLLHDSYDRYPLYDTVVIKLFIYIMTFQFKSIKKTINLTERKTERWTSRQLYKLIKQRKKNI